MREAKEVIPIYEPHLTGRERELLLDAFDSGWISGRGEYVEKFELGVSEIVGSRHAVAVSNGTVALTLALAALAIGAGDEVVMPAYTYVACANTVRHCGATPIFAEARPENAQVDLDDLRKRIGPRTRAVLIPHLYGFGTDLSDFASEVGELGVTLIEDSAEALGTVVEKRHVGNAGALATFSFFANKTVTTGEGGMVTTNDDQLANRLRRMRNQGIAPGDQYFHDLAGFNLRLTSLQAAIGVAQLERIDETLVRKREVADIYFQLLADLPLRFLRDPPDGRSSQWLVTAFLPPRVDRLEVISRARSGGVDLRPGFVPMYLLPMFKSDSKSFPQTESFHERVICMPSYPSIKDHQIEQVVSEVRKAIEHAL